jgi:hypothetical protein
MRGLSGFASRLVALEEFAGADVQRLAQGVQRLELDAGRAPTGFDEAVRLHLGDAAVAFLGELVGGREAALGHEFGESESHVQHATNVTTIPAISNSVPNACVVNGYVVAFGVPSEESV